MSSLRKDEKLEELFQQFIDGEEDALFEFMEFQRHEIFDYVFRMTGQSDRAISTVDDLHRTIPSVAQRVDSGASLRLKLFSAARRFHVDIWSAQTASLQNFSIEESESPVSGVTSHKEIPDRDDYLTIDRTLRTLAPNQREVLWLSCIGQFQVEDVSQIMGLPSVEVDECLQVAWSEMFDSCSLDVDEVRRLCATLPMHPFPGQNHGDTMAISQMIGELTESKRLLRRKRIKNTLIFLTLTGLLVWWLYDTGRWSWIEKQF